VGGEENKTMTDIEYISTDQSGLDSIGFLWEKLKEHHRVRSMHFAGGLARLTFEKRKTSLLDKVQNGFLHLDIAKEAGTGKFVGFCISSVTENKTGEIDDIFVESAYRGYGIGDVFMRKALAWMNGLNVERRVIAIGAGNEEVLPYYARFGFFPRITILTPPEKE
jgi:diamine N-acetyltransferase